MRNWAQQAAVGVRRYFTRAPRRALLRRRLCALCAPFVALALLSAGYLFWVCATGKDAVGLFDRQDVPHLHEKARSLLDWDILEPWKAHFAEGDADILEGRLTAAEQHFSEAVALADNPDSCPARINLVVVLESLADEHTNAGGLAHARADLAKAHDAMRDAPAGCFTPKPAAAGDQDARLFAETTARLRVKADQLAHGDLRYDPHDSTYHYTPGDSTAKLETPPGPGPCPQTNDPEQTACIRDKDQPPPPSDSSEQQDPSDDGAEQHPRGDGAPPEASPPQGSASPPGRSGPQGGPSDPNTAGGSINDIGPDRLPAPGLGPLQHKLNPQSGGDPADKIKQAQADANGSGEDHE
ncbi:conserved hypothetical protein [Segniliparus rotundus DSM 44985]|uniref:Uncharacterized protein n=1 Tax=Segniliparus rotundus (strain ATCC BAA-972 / CDC 1076 / CIP 108378 / DSM 44985 / JCM 13578) TaxID=640132 RepID=D6ZAH2_SEGRD|nr:hypothetical protein [Segniliparus rotundus]ADG96714.1 conserved hypothetical protein [Segniliparus rotundus DSM 44985]